MDSRLVTSCSYTGVKEDVRLEVWLNGDGAFHVFPLSTYADQASCKRYFSSQRKCP